MKLITGDTSQYSMRKVAYLVALAALMAVAMLTASARHPISLGETVADEEPLNTDAGTLPESGEVVAR